MGTLGFVCQSISYTITAPIYFTLHIFTSPTASSSVSAADVLPADPAEPVTLLLSNLIAFVIPTVGMLLPAPNSFMSAAAHYNWIAIWQAFPVYFPVLQWAFIRAFSTLDLFSSSRTQSHHPSPVPSTAVVYRTVIGIMVAAHLTLLAVALTPSSVLPAGWPTLTKVLDQVTLQSAVLPPSLFSPPSIDAKLNRAEDLAPATHFFLVYDLYCGSTALLLWAAYLRRAASGPGGKSFSWPGVVAKSLGWFVIGGPIAAAAALLWERDEELLRRDRAGGKKRL